MTAVTGLLTEASLRATEAQFEEEQKRNVELKSGSPLKFQIGLAISIIFMLGSICLISTAHQIPLPTGSSPFNPLRATIYVVGSSMLGGSLIATLVLAAKWWKLNFDIKKSDALLDKFAFAALGHALKLAQDEQRG